MKSQTQSEEKEKDFLETSEAVIKEDSMYKFRRELAISLLGKPMRHHINHRFSNNGRIVN